MATVTKPIALDESINTTELTPRNIADVLAEELKGIADNILPPNASQIAYDNTASGLTATNVQDAIDEVISSQADVIADTMADLTENKTAVVTDGVADFETIDGSLVKSLVVEIEPSQSGSGTPSPSNIRPITGYTEEKVTVFNKNYLGLGTQLDGYIASSGVFVDQGTSIGYYFKTEDLPDEITINDVGGNRAYISYFNTVPAQNVSCEIKDQSQATVPKTVTVNRAYPYIHIQLSYQKADVTDIQIEEGSTATTYEPYKNYTTTFGQTVYGGTLDVLTGELTIDRVIATVNDFTSAEGTSAGGLKYRNFEPSNYINTPALMMCNVLPYIEGNSAWSGTTPCYTSNNTRLRAYYEDGTWSNYSDIEIVYPLATPTTLSLTPQTVKALVGENHISASTGDVLECKFSMLINGDDLAMLLS